MVLCVTIGEPAAETVWFGIKTITKAQSGGNSWKQKHGTLASYPTPPSAMANRPFAHARILVADVLEQVKSGMAYEAIIEEWRYEIDRDAIVKAVRVSHLLPGESDLNEIEWLRAAATNPAFDFLKNPQEDIYTLADGDRFVDRSIKPQHTESGESQ